jgi:hypothetical protein
MNKANQTVKTTEFVVTREINGVTTYFCAFDTPKRKRIKGSSDWTTDPKFAQTFDTHLLAPSKPVWIDVYEKRGYKVVVEQI